MAQANIYLSPLPLQSIALLYLIRTGSRPLLAHQRNIQSLSMQEGGNPGKVGDATIQRPLPLRFPMLQQASAPLSAIRTSSDIIWPPIVVSILVCLLQAQIGPGRIYHYYMRRAICLYRVRRHFIAARFAHHCARLARPIRQQFSANTQFHYSTFSFNSHHRPFER